VCVRRISGSVVPVQCEGKPRKNADAPRNNGSSRKLPGWTCHARNIARQTVEKTVVRDQKGGTIDSRPSEICGAADVGSARLVLFCPNILSVNVMLNPQLHNHDASIGQCARNEITEQWQCSHGRG